MLKIVTRVSVRDNQNSYQDHEKMPATLLRMRIKLDIKFTSFYRVMYEGLFTMQKKNCSMFPCLFIQMMVMSVFYRVAQSISCGHKAHITDHKYMASISTMDRRHECGGAIIDKSHILTAAHCLEKRRKDEIYVTVGTEIVGDLNPSAQMRYVTKIQRHPQYEPGTDGTSAAYVLFLRLFRCFRKTAESDKRPANDIAVLTLDAALNFDDSVGKVTLPGPSPLTRCAPCSFSGWGHTSVAGTENTLYWIPFSILSHVFCRIMETPPRDNEFCAIDMNRRSCLLEGDSGGPLVCEGVIVGVLSRGTCDPKTPVIFTKVYDHLDSFIIPALRN